ncbi:DUF4270 family protein [Hymenobacter daecheongensis]|uniref:DUF4270 family protein n=1 Tax=Hymenobacter daecheongensis TaxID=496053 RepID=UPI000932A234|nr:DUF4270 family protein [Hymenobacter daecheongensis]
MFSAVLLFATAGCEDPNDLGVELPGTAPINTEYRDYPVTASTVLQTPVETLNSTHFLVGRLRDEKLGTTTAKAFLNLQIASIGTDSLPNQYLNPILDSVVVVAGFDQVYGSSAKPVSFDVYGLASSLDERSIFNSATTVPLLPSPIGEKRLSSLSRTKLEVRATGLKTKKDLAVDSTITVPVPDRTVRLKLYRKAAGTLPEIPSAFVQNLFTAIKDKATPFTQAKLNEAWKGIALQPSDNHSGSVVGFNRAFENRVLFYYHVVGGKKTPTPFSITFGNNGSANAPRAYTQIRSELTAPFDQLTDGTKSVLPTAPDQATYMQEGVGLGTKLEIPGLAELITNRQGLAINRAELIVPLKPETNLVFQAPKQAVLYELDATNKILQRTVNISPFERLVQSDGANQQGADAPATAAFIDQSRTTKYYSLTMTSYLQSYVYDALGGERPAALMLYPVVRYSPRSLGLTLNRAVLDAQNIKLRVYFSKLR